jgi:hypothetical protein
MPTSIATYPVEDNKQVTIDVLIGDQQPGGSTISLGTTEIISGNDQLSDVSIGLGSAVRGQKIIVVSEVENKNPATNNTSVAVTVKGGADSKELVQTQAAVNKGDIITYVTIVALT